MEFFSKLSHLGLESLTIKVIYPKKDVATVLIVPHSAAKDTALTEMKPLSLSGSTKEIDDEFFGRISEPLEKTSKLFDTVKEFEAQQAEVSKKTAIEKQRKDKIKSAKTKLEKILGAEGYNPEKDKAKAQKAIDELLELDPKNSYAIKAKQTLLEQTSEGTLF